MIAAVFAISVCAMFGQAQADSQKIGTDTLDVQPLPSGLVRTDTEVRSVKAVWTVAVTFPSEPPAASEVLRRTLEEALAHLRAWGVPVDFLVQKGFLLDRIEDLIAELEHDLHRPERAMPRAPREPAKPRRGRRGLLPFMGTIGKSLFGLATETDVEKLQRAMEDNRRYTEAVRHDQQELLSVMNVTRTEMAQNRLKIDDLIRYSRSLSSDLRGMYLSLDETMRIERAMSSFQARVLYLTAQVQRLWDRRQRFLAARRDLEAGSLSELLLPLPELEGLAADKLPPGTTFVRPLLWYYSKVDVRIVKMSDELVYVVRLPLVSEVALRAVEVVAYPVPNLKRNVTVQLQVAGLVALDPSTGLTQGLDRTLCSGRDPMVCIPGPIPRHVQSKLSCSNAVFIENNILERCNAEVAPRQGDSFHFHDINDYVLVTWGTSLREQCERVKTIHLDPGVYRLKWTGECSVCTPEYCIPSTVQLHSSLHLKKWEPLNITKFAFPNIAVQELKGLAIPPLLGDAKVVNLGKLLTATPPPPFRWSGHHTSAVTDIGIGTVVLVAIAIVVFCLCKKYGLKCCWTLCRKSMSLSLRPNDRARNNKDIKIIREIRATPNAPESPSGPSLKAYPKLSNLKDGEV